MLQALAGLPDGMFDCTELQFGNISEVPGMEHVGKFYCHFVCLWPLVSFCSHLVHYIVFPVFVCCTKKNLATLGARYLQHIFWANIKDHFFVTWSRFFESVSAKIYG
jgi:hypothetical protein